MSDEGYSREAASTKNEEPRTAAAGGYIPHHSSEILHQPAQG